VPARPLPGAADIGATLTQLMRVLRPGGVEQTDRSVAEAVGVSEQYIGMLRRGERRNPHIELLGRIADYFDVDVEIFRDSKRGAAINAELDGIAALRDLKIKNLMLRANGLSPKSLDLAAELIEHLRELEGLPEPGGNEGPGEKRRFG
jgi:transcriptional regulator with XRE-family HTH domain